MAEKNGDGGIGWSTLGHFSLQKEEQGAWRIYRSLLSCAFSGGTPQAGPKSQLGFHQALRLRSWIKVLQFPIRHLCTVSTHGLAL